MIKLKPINKLNKLNNEIKDTFIENTMLLEVNGKTYLNSRLKHSGLIKKYFENSINGCVFYEPHFSVNKEYWMSPRLSDFEKNIIVERSVDIYLKKSIKISKQELLSDLKLKIHGSDEFDLIALEEEFEELLYDSKILAKGIFNNVVDYESNLDVLTKKIRKKINKITDY
ncbi:hypothetical protein K9L67_02945 [Candidatus Woesearchaeota archaeon]|nr:hypothetical protein [Candidatus Woesearchaeota archaeon]MCF7901158.1 hypothetical protein [Candidatus Woesearchaeota archaeon]MCF8013665.1 hypothetical protein [Candidatus Woesearchaeota archaeon]